LARPQLFAADNPDASTVNETRLEASMRPRLFAAENGSSIRGVAPVGSLL